MAVKSKTRNQTLTAFILIPTPSPRSLPPLSDLPPSGGAGGTVRGKHWPCRRDPKPGSSSPGCSCLHKETDHPSFTWLTRLDCEFEVSHCRTRRLLDGIINQPCLSCLWSGVTGRHRRIQMALTALWSGHPTEGGGERDRRDLCIVLGDCK